jgi:hypothetical protein
MGGMARLRAASILLTAAVFAAVVGGVQVRVGEKTFASLRTQLERKKWLLIFHRLWRGEGRERSP